MGAFPRLAVVWLPALLPGLLWAAEPLATNFPGAPISAPPRIDGEVSPAEWAEATALEGAFDTEVGSPGPFRQRFWIAYDDRYLYVAAQLEDPEPRAIRATQYRQNVGLGGDDSVGFDISPFGNINEFNSFSFNPRGATSISIAGGRAAKVEWLGEFVARARVTETGWEGEARIPWAIMRLPGAGKRDVRFSFSRYIPRLQKEFLVRDVSVGKVENYPRWLDVRIPFVPVGREIKLLPYGYLGGADGEGPIINSGLDFKYQPTSEIDVVGTISPDFRNVENQILSLDFSYFERLAGESRPFFQEGGEFFQSSFDSTVFASQRIQRIDTGVKAFGRLDPKTTFGILNTADFGNQNAFVASVAHNMNDRGFSRITVTDLSEPGVSNRTVFLSASQQVGLWGAFGQLTRTQDHVDGNGQRVNAGVWYSGPNFYANTEYVEIDDKYRARLGFTPERNLKGFQGSLNWETSVPRGPLMEWEVGTFGLKYDQIDGSPYREFANVYSSLTFRDGTDLDFGASTETFFDNEDVMFFVSIEKPRREPYRRWGLGVNSGRVAGKRYQSVELEAGYRPLPLWQVNASLELVEHFEFERQGILSMNYDLNQSDSLGGRLTWREDELGGYFSWRRAGNRGVEYFLIVGDPNSRGFRGSVILKATVPLSIRW